MPSVLNSQGEGACTPDAPGFITGYMQIGLERFHKGTVGLMPSVLNSQGEGACTPDAPWINNLLHADRFRKEHKGTVGLVCQVY